MEGENWIMGSGAAGVWQESRRVMLTGIVRMLVPCINVSALVK